MIPWSIGSMPGLQLLSWRQFAISSGAKTICNFQWSHVIVSIYGVLQSGSCCREMAPKGAIKQFKRREFKKYQQSQCVVDPRLGSMNESCCEMVWTCGDWWWITESGGICSKWPRKKSEILAPAPCRSWFMAAETLPLISLSRSDIARTPILFRTSTSSAATSNSVRKSGCSCGLHSKVPDLTSIQSYAMSWSLIFPDILQLTIVLLHDAIVYTVLMCLVVVLKFSSRGTYPHPLQYYPVQKT